MARAADPVLAREAALRIVRRLREMGHVAYFAGGCVRDELLSLRPTDFDVATDSTPARVRELFPRTAEVGQAFGVVLVYEQVAGEKAVIEVATFRADGPYSDARRPDRVHFSTPEEDARRRDFTINALFLDPLLAPGEQGRVIDFVGGQDDLAARVIRAVGDPDQRLAEDHLRALRAVRLSARLGFALDGPTGSAIARHARDLEGVSRERIGEELRKMLGHASRARAVRMLHELGLDAPVLGEAAGTFVRGGVVEALGEANIPVPTALGAWALDRGVRPDPAGAGELSRRWRRALCLSNDETHQLNSMLTGVWILEGSWNAMGVAARKRAAGSAWFGEAERLVAARDRARAGAIAREVEILKGTRSGISPAPLITGEDLIDAGLTPGPVFKSVLERVYDAQLEDRIDSVAAGLALAKELAKG